MTHTPRHRVLVISVGRELSNDARILRQVEFLASRFDVVLAGVGWGAALPEGVEFIRLPSEGPELAASRLTSALRVALRMAGRYQQAYWRDSRVRRWRDLLARVLPVDAIVANELYPVPLALGAGGGAPVVFDAHEHWTSESASWTRLQRLSMRGSHDWMVARCVPRTAAVMTVSTGIARDFRERFGVSPQVVTNAPFFQALSPSLVTEPIRLLHVGLADARRRLEDSIEAVRMLDDRFTLDLVLMRENEYRRRLERLAASDARIRVLPPVPNADLIRFANDYDVGVFLLPARFPNQTHVLPNKLFDYIQARLAIAIGPSLEMAEVVREWDCGVVSESFAADSFAESLSRLTVQEVQRMKFNADRAARELNAESNRETVVNLVEQAISGRPAIQRS